MTLLLSLFFACAVAGVALGLYWAIKAHRELIEVPTAWHSRMQAHQVLAHCMIEFAHGILTGLALYLMLGTATVLLTWAYTGSPI